VARLPGENYLIQQIGGVVVLYHEYTEEEVVRYDPSDANETARAQLTIYSSDALTAEQKCFAHFWSGYFYAHSDGMPDTWLASIPISIVPMLPGEGHANDVGKFARVDTTHFHVHDQTRAEDKTFESGKH
jgi:hypothetical protein